MAFTLIGTTSTSVISLPVREALLASIERCGRAVLLVDTLDTKKTVQKLLAADPVLSLGLTVSTLFEWAEELWRLFGNGRPLISGELRKLCIFEALESFEPCALDPLSVGAGVAQAVEQLTQGDLYCTQDQRTRSNLTAGEKRVLTVLDRYLELIHERGFLEKDESYTLLTSLLPQSYCEQQSIVVSGVENLTFSEKQFLCNLSQNTDVQVVLSTPQNEAGNANRELLARLSRLSHKDVLFVNDVQEPHDAEVEALLHTIFLSRQTTLPLKSQGKVTLLSPAGILAEPALIIEHIQSLIAQGVKSFGIYAPQQNEAWRQLAPRLAAHGISAKTVMRQAVSDSACARAFLGLVRAVCKLKNLCEVWPDASQAELGDMSWWPPREIVDFLFSPLSFVSTEKAWDIDKMWRKNRILTPDHLLRFLRQASATSKECAATVESILNGRIEKALHRLLLACDEHREDFDDETYLLISNSLSAIMAVAQALHKLEAKADIASEQKFYEVALQKSFSLCLNNGVAENVDLKAPVSVEILSDKSIREPNTFDAVICLGMDSVNTSLPTKDKASDLLTEKLEGAKPIAPLAEGRRRLYRMLASARTYVSLVCVAHSEDSNKTFASVVLKELLSCYETAEGEFNLPQLTRGEGRLSANLLLGGKTPAKVNSLPLQPTGSIPETLKPFVILPSYRGTEQPQIQELSASQIESYLECPYKWFVQRRLKLDRVDAGFSSLEKGTFIHRVLELTHMQLLQEALGTSDALSDEYVWQAVATSLPDSRISQDTLAHAQHVLSTQFDALAKEQFIAPQKTQRRTQRLVPHTVAQHQQMQKLREDLFGLLDFETDKFVTFEPRFFELKFGADGGFPATYAGVAFTGSIDRIDVNAQGEAVIIDYKHKAAQALNSYAVQKSAIDQNSEGDAPSHEVLPRHVQAIIYAQVVRMYLKSRNLTSVGAIYLGTHQNYALYGAAPESYINKIFGLSDEQKPSKGMLSCVAGDTVGAFNEYLDAWEDKIKQAVERMLNGDIHAHALDKEACAYCPVMNCSERKR